VGPTRYHQVLKEARTLAIALPNNRLCMRVKNLSISLCRTTERVSLRVEIGKRRSLIKLERVSLALSELKTGPSPTARRGSREAVG
jgi:hypothetical protein